MALGAAVPPACSSRGARRTQRARWGEAGRSLGRYPKPWDNGRVGVAAPEVRARAEVSRRSHERGRRGCREGQGAEHLRRSGRIGATRAWPDRKAGVCEYGHENDAITTVDATKPFGRGRITEEGDFTRAGHT